MSCPGVANAGTAIAATIAATISTKIMRLSTKPPPPFASLVVFITVFLSFVCVSFLSLRILSCQYPVLLVRLAIVSFRVMVFAVTNPTL